MQLVGMLDSPYVRRCAISLKLLEIGYEHRPLSVFRHFEEFERINPVVKAPTLVCDDGTVLMDSTLILEFAEATTTSGRTLMPVSPGERVRSWRILGLALAACEKSVSIVYEQQLRPPEKRHEPWVARMRGQLLAACSALEAEMRNAGLGATADTILQAGVTSAVTWNFVQMVVPEVVVASEYPAWGNFAAAAEKLPEFVATLEEWTAPSPPSP